MRWEAAPGGGLRRSAPDPLRKPSQFEALSKNLDAEELSSLVRTKLGVDLGEAEEGYRSKL